MIIDAHTHFLKGYMGAKAGALDQLEAHLQQNRVDKAVLFTVQGFFSDCKAANDELHDAARRFPERFLAWCTVNPRDGQGAIDELRRCVEELGMGGCKLHSWLQSFSVSGPQMPPIVEECIRLGMPLIFHDGTPPFSTPLQIADLARRYPESAIILAHSGLRDLWPNALAAARNNPNIWLGTCGTPLLGIQRIVEAIGPERVIFGSDGGFGSLHRIAREKMKIELLDIREDEKQDILGRNMQRLLASVKAR